MSWTPSSVNILQNYIKGRYVTSTGGVQNEMSRATIDFSTGTTGSTSASVTYTKPKDPISSYMINVVNNSTVTDLTCNVYSVETDLSTNSTGCDSLLDTLSFPKEKTSAYLISGIFNGSNAKFVFSNDTTTLAAQGFTNYMTIKEFK